MRTVSQLGLSLLKINEGLRLESYLCKAGRWTIGYGMTEGIGPGMRITREEAERSFLVTVQKFASHVEKHVTVKLSDDQFAALVCLTYNIGRTAFASSTLLRKLNAKDYEGAAAQFDVWRLSTNPKTKKKEIDPILVRRRRTERLLFEGKVASLHA